MNSNLNIAVVGAGILGANTILQVKRKFPNANITLIDDKFNDETLSYGPAGIFRPGSQFGGSTSEQLARQWVQYSFQYYNDLLCLPNTGVLPLEGYIFSNTAEQNVKNTFLECILPTYRGALKEELNMFNNSWTYGSYFETIRIQCSNFIPWAINKFKEAGGETRKCKIREFTDLENEFNVVFNCTGLAAKYLCNDRHVLPIRGQLITVHAPWITKFYYNDLDTFIVPLGDGNVTLGTTRNYENYKLQVDKFDTASILDRCATLVPGIKEEKIINEWVGLRPYRHSLRLEIEKRSKFTIVHNYGHGGYGITTAPGTTNFVIEEFRKFHSCNSKL